MPFTVTIPRRTRPQLTEKLKAEWPQILQWLIEGCAEWQEHGLAAPGGVGQPRNISPRRTRCAIGWPSVWGDGHAPGSPSALCSLWQQWAEANGEYVGSDKALSQRLLDLGFT